MATTFPTMDCDEFSESKAQPELSPTISHDHLTPPPPRRQAWTKTASTVWRIVLHHFAKHAGAGVMASVAYFDPGNWGVDLQAGSQFEYSLLFVVLLSGIFAVILQVMAYRLGCITGLDLASHCRVLLYDNPRHPRLVRWFVLYPLYALSEIAIISTDLAELLGTAIALSMIFPKLPLWAGVLLTSADVLFILALSGGEKGRPAKLFELLIVVLVSIVFVCLIVLVVEVKPAWPAVFFGFLPSKTVFKSGALYTSIGIIGATVMPHALFLGSSLATLDRESPATPSLPRPSVSSKVTGFKSILEFIRSLFTVKRNPGEEEDAPDRRTPHQYRVNNSLSFVRAHLRHGITDLVMSLMGLAIPINSAILVLAGAVFFNNASSTPSSAGLFDVYAYIQTRLGQAAAYIFAIALLFAGQSATITVTLSGQIISEGFIEWKVSPFTRRLVTRIIGLIPSAVVAAVLGRNGLDVLLVASQVALSIVLPFIIFPLVYLTSNPVVMRVKAPTSNNNARPIDLPGVTGTPSVEQEGEVNFRNGKIMMTLGYLIFLLVVVANVYALVTL